MRTRNKPTPAQKELIIKYSSQMTQREIAEKTNLSAATVNRVIHSRDGLGVKETMNFDLHEFAKHYRV